MFDGKEHAKQQSMYYSATADDTSVFCGWGKKAKQHTSLLTDRSSDTLLE